MKNWRNYLASVTVIAVLMTCEVACAQAEQEAGATSRPFEKRILQRFDKDGDGKLSPKEREDARKEWEQLRKNVKKRQSQQVPDGVLAIRDLEYARVNNKPLLLDLYLSTKAKIRQPVIVWIHGGGWSKGSKNGCPAIPLSAEGYNVVSINYRLTDEASFPAQIDDCKGAIRWVRANANKYGFDPDRIGVWGSSAGGHLVALLGTSGGVKEVEGDVGDNETFSSRVQAVADFCGPSSFHMENLQDLPDVKQGKTPDAVRMLLGGPISENLAKARLASPVDHVTPDDPPFLIVHGEKDPIVPVKQARILADALEKAGVEVTLQVLPDAGHGVLNSETAKLAAEFFDKHLKKDKKLQPATKPN